MAEHKGTVTLPAGARHLFSTDEGKYVWWPALQTVQWIPRGCRQARGTWPLSLNQNTKGGAMIVGLTQELKIQRSAPL